MGKFITAACRSDSRPEDDERELSWIPRPDDFPLPWLRAFGGRHYTARQRFVIDLVIVLVIGVLAGLVLNDAHAARVRGEVWTVLAWISGIGSVPLVLLRRRFPWPVFVLLTVSALMSVALRGPGVMFFYMVMSLYVVVSRSSRATGLSVALTVFALDICAGLVNGGNAQQPAASVVIGTAGLVALGWVAAENTRQSQIYSQRRAREAAAAAAAAEADREERTRRTIADERVLIARELHDIVAHTMSVIAVRAGVGRMVVDAQPEEAAEALQIIETTARSSLAEMRLMVSILRSEGSANPHLGPLPGLEELERLVAQTQTAGVQVQLEITGTPRELSPLADLTAYRIVQEALTNVVRHAGPTSAQVTVSYRSEALELEVVDQGPSPESDKPAALGTNATGHGLVGMQERTAMFGGTVEAAPYGHGFRVHAILPLDENTPSLGPRWKTAHE